MATLIVEHDVEDYDNWQHAYLSHGYVRDKYGLLNPRIYRLSKNPNRVCFLLEGKPDQIEAFVNDPTLQDALLEGGVTGRPSIQILDGAALRV